MGDIRIRPEDVGTVTLPKEIKDDYVILDGLTGYTVDGIKFSNDTHDKDMLLLKNCKNCIISNCKFSGKSTKGNFIKLLGENTEGNLIDHCEFTDHTFTKENGGESIRIGNSDASGLWFKTTIQNCYFHDLAADDEDVSIKSCGNVLQNNRHENCKSSFTIRHGGSNRIQNNVFIGYGGIRVYGDGNHIIGNVHLNNNYLQFKDEDDKEKYKLPLTISNGNLEDDINLSSESTPSGKLGCTHAVYARVKNNVIKDNTFYNCEGTCVVWGNKKYDEVKVCNDKKLKVEEPLPPTRNMLINNLIAVDDGRGDSTLVVFNAGVTSEAAKSNNTFEYNKYCNAKLGEIPQKPDEDKLTARPEFSIPDVWPPVKLEEIVS